MNKLWTNFPRRVLISLKNKGYLVKQAIFSPFKKRAKSKAAEQAFLRGFDEFEKSGKNSENAYQGMVTLYCNTNGKYIEDFHQKARLANPPARVLGNSSGILGNLDSGSFKSINEELNQNGYIEFEKKLSPDLCAKLYAYALTTPAVVKGKESKILYDPAKPVSEIYRLGINDLINNKDIQDLIMDPQLMEIARNYLGCEPIFDFPAMWWSTSYLKTASSEAAQLYHFDLDRLKWLKLFFYINDVGPNNGPHCYIRGSHKPGTKPEDLLKRGYSRIEDKDLRKYYSIEDFKTIEGQAGAIFAGDTKCWHKGMPLQEGHRLALELEYTASLFGAIYPKMVVENSSAKFRSFCHENKVYASNLFFHN
jgi:hypothetical protein